MNALKDQLLKAGFSLPPAPAKPDRVQARQSVSSTRPQKTVLRTPATVPVSHEPGLKEAFAQRERSEQQERIELRRAAEQEAQLRKTQRTRLKTLLALHPALNDEQAEIPRNFLWARKIRRIYLTSAQQQAVNAGQLGVIALDGRFHLHTAEVVQAVAAIDPNTLGLLVDSSKPQSDPGEEDPRFQVPDDLVW